MLNKLLYPAQCFNPIPETRLVWTYHLQIAFVRTGHYIRVHSRSCSAAFFHVASSFVHDITKSCIDCNTSLEHGYWKVCRDQYLFYAVFRLRQTCRLFFDKLPKTFNTRVSFCNSSTNILTGCSHWVSCVSSGDDDW